MLEPCASFSSIELTFDLKNETDLIMKIYDFAKQNISLLLNILFFLTISSIIIFVYKKLDRKIKRYSILLQNRSTNNNISTENELENMRNKYNGTSFATLDKIVNKKLVNGEWYYYCNFKNRPSDKLYWINKKYFN